MDSAAHHSPDLAQVQRLPLSHDSAWGSRLARSALRSSRSQDGWSQSASRSPDGYSLQDRKNVVTHHLGEVCWCHQLEAGIVALRPARKSIFESGDPFGSPFLASGDRNQNYWDVTLPLQTTTRGGCNLTHCRCPPCIFNAFHVFSMSMSVPHCPFLVELGDTVHTIPQAHFHWLQSSLPALSGSSQT